MIEDLVGENRTRIRSLLSMILNFWLVLFTIVLIFILCITVLFRLCLVDGESMLDTLKNKSYIICDSPNDLKRGDIVVAAVSDKSVEKNIVKRIVAAPGDKIVFVCTRDYYDNEFFADVKLYICDQDDKYVRQDENYIRNGEMTTLCFTEHMFSSGEFNLLVVESFSEYLEGEAIDESCIITLDENEYFLLGDNRDNSRDSREYGKFLTSDISGKFMFEIDSGPLYYIIDFLFMVRGIFL